MNIFTKSKKNKYYSLDKIKSTDSVYNLIIGERSNGKTYAVLEEGIKQYMLNRGQLALVRRWKEDIIGKRASSIFNGLIEDGKIKKITKGLFTGVVYYNGRFYLCNYDDKGKPIYSDDDVLGFLFALSDTEHNKSISFPRVTTIMFDEFLTSGTYLVDEFVLFMNTVSTIVRQRTNVKIYMLGNTVNKYSPYFNEMGLNNASKMKQGTIDIYQYGDSDLTVAVEYCSTMKHNKKNNFYFAFDNPKLEMITGGAWELSIYPHLPVKYKPKHIQLIYFIIFNGDIFQCEVISLKSELFTFIHKKTTDIKDDDNDLVYSFDYKLGMNYNRNIYKPMNNLQEKILWFYKYDRVYFQDNSVGNSIDNYLKICRGF